MLDADRALQAFVKEETCIPFAPLVQFADPLFEAYGIDPGRALALRTAAAPDEAPEELVLVLETARLLWHYFALEGDAVLDALPRIEGALLQGDVTDRDRVALHLLLARLEDGWHELEAERLPSGNCMPPAFEVLLARYHDLYPPEAGEAPDDDPEALAAFARPLLEAPEVMADPDAFDRHMELAHALFEWVQTGATERPTLLARIARRFPDFADRLPALADEMLARYHTLFPDNSPA